jgi:hypothetical protein
MSAADQNPENAGDDSNEQCADKQIRWHGENGTSLANTTEIEDSDDDQNADTKGNHMRKQRRNGGDQSSDACGNTHCGCQDVVGEQRGRGEQSGRGAEIETRHGIRTTAGGIGRDGLAIRKVNDHEQRDDGGADRDDVANAQQSKRNQKAEGSFRAVSRGAQAIETKDRNALRGTDLFGPLVTGFDRFADNEIKYVHEGWCSMDGLRSEIDASSMNAVSHGRRIGHLR